MPENTSAVARRRLEGWTAITGLTLIKLIPLGIRAYEGYTNNDTLYGSGFQAGETLSEHLPDDPSDLRIRAWGDFLIDLGAASMISCRRTDRAAGTAALEYAINNDNNDNNQ